MDYTTQLRIGVGTAGAIVWNVCSPAVPNALICTAMVGADVVTAYMLSRRVARQRLRQGLTAGDCGKVQSRRLGRAILTLAKIYWLLAVSAALDRYVSPGQSISVLRMATGAVVFCQALSILENEASCSEARWARYARRWLINKARRHYS